MSARGFGSDLEARQVVKNRDLGPLTEAARLPGIRVFQAVIVASLALLPSCSSSPTSPAPDATARLAFSSSSLDLGGDLQASTSLKNMGEVAVGPIAIVASQLQRDGAAVPGARVLASPDEIPTLNPGSSATVSLRVESDVTLLPGSYSAQVEAMLAGRSEAPVGVAFRVAAQGEAASVEILNPPSTARQGDVIALAAEARDESGNVLPEVTIAWQVQPPGAGVMTAEGHFVGYGPGAVQITASVGSVESTASVEITPRGLPNGSFRVVGQGEKSVRFSSDLWVHGDCAYAGTWGDRLGQLGNRLNTWDISDPSAPQAAGAVRVDARVVNDVKVRADGTLGVISHEFSVDQQNGITLLDLSDPCQPAPIARFTAGLQSGVHNLWIEDDYVYVVTDNIGSGLRVLDVSDPANPSLVASFADPFSFLHDVYVRDGLAFLSHWDSGLFILDVGNGIAGGSPSNPAQVGRAFTSGGQTHNAWYWPETGYVFVGEEDFQTPGIMHVVDASDPTAPVEVATFSVPGDTPHNFWLDEGREILYMAWYANGIYALDVSGQLLGELDRQGRILASRRYSGFGPCPGGPTGTCTWAPQLHQGLIYLSDMNTGLWVLEPQF